MIRRIALWFLAAAVTILGSPLAYTYAQTMDAPAVEPASYALGHLAPSGRVRDNIPRSLWKDGVDSLVDAPIPNPAVAIGSMRAFYVRAGELVSRDLRTGKVFWKSGAGLVPAILLNREFVYAAAKDGTVLAFNAATGRTFWSTRTGCRDIDSFSLLKGLLFANSRRNGLVALNPHTGAAVWPAGTLSDYGSFGPQASAHGVVVVLAISGEPLANHAYGIRIRDGKVLWQQSGSWFPIAVRGDVVYLRDRWGDIDMVNTFAVGVIDLLTGKVRRSFTYELTPVDRTIMPRYERALIQGNDVYLDMGCAVYRLRLGSPASSRVEFGIRGKACRGRFNAKGQGFRGEPGWLAGPYRSRLFLWDGQHLYALGMATRRAATYDAINANVSRLVLTNDRIYVGQVDGWFAVLNMNSGAVLFKASTGGRNFDIHVGSDVVVVQAEQTLIAFPNP